jgi:undecaprenyl phosphate-alpha-L-ara4FN deformylase
MRTGLRVDVDTFRGTQYGVPNLCNLLADHGVFASFFFSVGPDNMGRHLWRVFRLSFLRKMLRSKAPSLYGWDILLKGTFWPGPVIGEKLGHIMRSTSDEGHEVGLHAWDHYSWQTYIDIMDRSAIHRSLEEGVGCLEKLLGHSPVCSAAPAWRVNDLVLLEKAKFPFRYNSDVRGESIFYPLVKGREILQPQIPVTLPTYDEVIGHRGISDSNYNDFMLSLLESGKLNVLTIHAEVEGISRLQMFDSFVKKALFRGASFVPLGALLEDSPSIGRAAIAAREIHGREGWVSCQIAIKTTDKQIES